MLTIANTSEVLEKARIARQKREAQTIIEINGKKFSVQKQKQLKTATPAPIAEPPTEKPVLSPVDKAPIATTGSAFDLLQIEYNALMKERKKLSSQIWKMVENDADKEALKRHYEKIEAYRPNMVKLYNDMRYYQRYGELPRVQQKNEIDISVLQDLKDKRKKLIDKRCKLKAKIAKTAGKSSPKLLEWQLEMDKVDVAYQVVAEQLANLRETHEG